MRGKLLGFALALLSVATIGAVQLTAKALEPGQVDNAPVCTAKSVGERSKAFKITGSEATVKFKVTGRDNCRVKLSANSFYAPSISGRPYNQQILYQRVTKNFTRGTYEMSVGLPTNSTPQKGCFWQIDLTYGIHNTTPMIAYGHGKVKNCGEPQPSAVCKNLNVDKIERTKFRFNAKAEAKNGAKINSYTFVVTAGGQIVDQKTVQTSKAAASYVYNQSDADNYKVRVTVDTSLGKKTDADCVKQFTVEKEPSAVCKNLTIEKLQNNQYRFTGTAATQGNASVSAYEFNVTKDGQVIDTKTVTTSALTASSPYTQAAPGTYTVNLKVQTSVGSKTAPSCVKQFTIPEEETNPTAVCKSLSVETIKVNEQFRFNATAEVTDGATISAYEFTVSKNGAVINTQTVTTSATTASLNYNQTEAGNYLAKVVVKTSLGDRNGAQCEAPFTVTPPEEEENPGVKVTKLVANQKYKRVGVNVEYNYQIAVTNTGDINLTNVVVTDTPQAGITLVSASAGTIAGNTWTHTIPALNVGQTVNFTLQAKVPVTLAGMLKNTVCVDAPEIPGNPDDCDDADVDVEKGKIKVCVIASKEIVTINEDDFDAAIHTTDFSKCDVPVIPPVTPAELPQTGAADVIVKLIGASSVVGAGSYYFASRRLRA